MLDLMLNATGSSGICVNGSGLNWKDLGYLRRIQFLDVFCIRGFSKDALEKLEGLDSQTHLKELALDVVTKANVEWQSFPKIKKIFIDSCFVNFGLWNCQSLVDLAISNCSEDSWGNFSKLKSLEKLTIVRGGMKDLNGLIGSELLSLEMHLVRKLGALSGAFSLPKIRRLYINGSRRINDVEAISGFDKLEELHLVDCGYIKTLRPLMNLKNLKYLYLYNTFVEDDGIRLMIDLPNLKEFVFDEKPSYDMRLKDVLVHIGVPKASWPAILRE